MRDSKSSERAGPGNATDGRAFFCPRKILVGVGDGRIGGLWRCGREGRKEGRKEGWMGEWMDRMNRGEEGRGEGGGGNFTSPQFPALALG